MVRLECWRDGGRELDYTRSGTCEARVLEFSHTADCTASIQSVCSPPNAKQFGGMERAAFPRERMRLLSQRFRVGKYDRASQWHTEEEKQRRVQARPAHQSAGIFSF